MLEAPTTVVVGYVPRSPLTVVGPVLVMPAPARTAKLSAVPSGTEDAAAAAPLTSVSKRPSTNRPHSAVAPKTRRRLNIERVMVDLLQLGLRRPPKGGSSVGVLRPALLRADQSRYGFTASSWTKDSRFAIQRFRWSERAAD